MLRASLITTLCLAWPVLSFAQDAATTDELYGLAEARPVAAQNQDRCISQMADFPTDDPTARYQFFKLVSDVAYGANTL